MGQIEFSYVTEPGVGASAIRWFTHSDFSHAEIIWPGGARYGARSDYLPEPGVRWRAPLYADFSRDWRVVVPVSEDQAKKFYAFLDAQFNKPYDWKSLVAFAVPHHWRQDDAWFCSELCAAAKEHAGIVRFHTPATRITPNDDFLVTAAIPGATVLKVVG